MSLCLARLINIFMCVDVSPAFTLVHHVDAVPTEARKGHQSLWDSNYSRLLVTTCKREPNPGPLQERAASTPDTLTKRGGLEGPGLPD